MKKPYKVVIILGLFILLALVRVFEDRLFFDPLLDFFKTDHSTEPLPEFNTVKALLHVVFRFMINTVLSLAILWIAFRDRGVIKLSIFMYGLLLVVGIIIYSLLLSWGSSTDHMILFYVRRFLIQPVFLLLLMPAFYFHKRGA